MPKKRKRAAPAPVASPQLEEDFVRADPHVLALLAVSDVPTWERLLNPVNPSSDACPSALVHALLAIDDAEGWQRRCDLAWGGRAPWDGGSGAQGHYVFRPWFARGVLRHVPATHLASLGHRYRALVNDASADTTIRARELVAALEDQRTSEAQSLLGKALLLLACRLCEDGDHEGGVAATQRAEGVFARLGDESSRVRAVRMRGAALLRCRRIDDALAVLDTVKDAPTVTSLPIEPRAPTPDDVFFRSAAQAESGTDSKAWFDALARMAEAAGHHAAAERAVAGLRRVTEREEASAGEIARSEAAAKREDEERRAAIQLASPVDGQLLRIFETVDEEGGRRVWKWAVYGAFNPVYDATASADGVEYYCEIQGPFCGYDPDGSPRIHRADSSLFLRI